MQLNKYWKKEYDPFHDIDTNYLFEKYCVQELSCLVSLCNIYRFMMKIEPLNAECYTPF